MVSRARTVPASFMNVSGSGESLFAALENEKLITFGKKNIIKEGKIVRNHDTI